MIKCNSLAIWSNNFWDTLSYLSSNYVRSILTNNNELYVTGAIEDGFQVWDGNGWHGLNWGGIGIISALVYYRDHYMWEEPFIN